MKKLFLVTLMCLMALLMSAQKCAVLEFRGSASVSVSDVDGITEMFMTYFQPAGYTMIERAQIDKVISEQHLQRSNITDSQAVRLGKILNASVVIVGKVSGLDGYQVDVRAVDVQSGHDLAFEGASFGGDFREDVRDLATELAAKIAIRPAATEQPTPSKTVQSTTPKVRQKVDILYGYLKIFPKELGKFPSEPKTIIKRINQQAQYGYNNWRLPTEEEEALLRAEEKYIEEGQQYMTYESRTEEGIVLLVSDGEDFATIKRAEKARKDSIDAAEEKARQDSIAEENRIAEEARIAAAKMKARQDSIAEVNRIEEEARIAAAREKARQDSIAAVKEKERQDSIAEANRIEDDRRKSLEVRNASLDAHGYVDLGLPSGILWKSENEDCGLVTYDQAYNFYGEYLPTQEQWQELKDKCLWIWTGSGYNVKGRNGESIMLPAAGFRSCGGSMQHIGSAGFYWSDTPTGPERAWNMNFDSGWVCMVGNDRCSGRSVRLVKIATSNDYVDLGLPSGTLWKDQNEAGGFYMYDQAMVKFGDNLPTEEQFKELKTSCQWTWTGSGYSVMGPNGNRIFMPATGCSGSIVHVGMHGYYWLSTPYSSEGSWCLFLDSIGASVSLDGRCHAHSVRLVKNQ